MSKRKRRSTALVCLTLICACILTACGGVTQEQYDAVCAQRDELRAALETLQRRMQEEERVTVHIGGEFTATVRGLIPDYVLDDFTPSVAVVTLFQSEPFLLFCPSAEQLETGRSYVFTVKEKQVEMTRAEYEEGSGFADEMISRYGLSISGFRLAGESETGLDADHIVKWIDEK